MIYYFSATGNSRALATTLSHHLNDRAVDIVPLLGAHTVPCTLGANEPLGFVFPIYGWSLPNIVRDFILKLSLSLKEGQEGVPRYVYFAVTCGDDVGVADRHIREALARVGLQLNAGYSVNMPDSYVCLPGFDVDTDEERKRKFSLFPTRVAEIADKIARRQEVMDIKRGACAWIKTNVLGWYFRKRLITDKPFRTTDDCIGCGTCVSVCPLGNITLGSDARPEWHGHCTGCLACYHHCPTRAIRFGRRTERKGQYLYPERERL